MQRKNLDRCDTAHQIADAKFNVLAERMAGHFVFDDERWRAHDRTHTELARNLTDYKRDSNEWRSSLSDLRATFQSKSEFEAKHDALGASLAAEVKPIESRLATVETWQLARDARERGVTSTLTAQRAVLLVVGSVIGTILAVGSLVTLFVSVVK